MFDKGGISERDSKELVKEWSRFGIMFFILTILFFLFFVGIGFFVVSLQVVFILCFFKIYNWII